ncbi:MAG TPA: hypothetical protein VKA01_16345 [Vicinamibacteria bacterium]|nr:hypothetical protein [Vicinamibacteria bacterium]
MRRYVLGELEEGLRAELEELLVTDTEAFEALGVIEDELIEEYLEGTGSAAERQGFEERFLTTPERSRRLQFARALKERAAHQERAQAPPPLAAKGLFPASRWQWVPTGLAATLAVSLIGNAWLTSRVLQLKPAVSLPAPAPSVRPEAATVRVVEPTPPPLATMAVASPNPLESSRPPAAVHTFVLAAGLLRSGGSLPRLIVPADAVVVRLLLELPGDDYPLYRAALLDAEGDEIWAASKLKAEPGKAAVAVGVPSSYLSRGDYQARLSGMSKGAEPEGVGTYAFRVGAP